MTELDVPRPILMDVNRIRYYFNIIRVVTEKIGEDCADKGFHTAAVVRAQLILAPGRMGTENYTFPHTSKRRSLVYPETCNIGKTP